MMSSSARHLLIIGGLLVAIFVLDLATPLGWAFWILYLVPLLLSLRLPAVKAPLAVAAICMVLMALGSYYSPPGILPAVAHLNQALGALTIWIAALLIVRYRRAAEARSQLVAIMESSPDAIIGEDLNGVVTSWNHAAEALLGYRAEEMIGRSLSGIIPEEHRAEKRKMVEQFRQGQLPCRFETQRRHRDGYDIHVTVSLAPIKDEFGRFVGVSKILHDITERKQIEQALQAREQEYRAIFDLSGVGLWQADAVSGRLLRVNRRLCELTGYSVEELRGKKFLDFAHPDDREAAAAEYQRLIRGETAELSFEKRYLRKDGNEIWVSVTATILRDEAGRPLYGVAVIQDMTARRQSELERERLVAELQKSLAEASAD